MQSNRIISHVTPLAIILTAIVLTSLLTGCLSMTGTAPEPPWFRDVSAETGMQVGNFDPNPAEPIPYNCHARTRIADINGDGYEDLIGHTMWPNASAGLRFDTQVFLATGNGDFIDFTMESGLNEVQAAFMLFADFDNDGDQDAFAGLDYPMENEPNNLVLLNDGTGRFAPVENSGVAYEENLRTGNAVAADFDGDGILDLFVGNGNTVFMAPDHVFKGLGDGRFELIEDALEDAPKQPTNGSIALDYDSDGDLDIFVSTYGVSKSRGHNHLWENRGNMHFVNVAYDTDVAALRTGNYWLARTDFGRGEEAIDEETLWIGSNGFGVDAADIDGDGYIDIYLATISHPTPYDKYREWSDPTQLLFNRPAEDGSHRVFVNEFRDRGLPYNEGEIDAAIVDMNNDGYYDLAVSRESKYESNYETEAQMGWFGVMKNNRDNTFSDITISSGINTGGEYHLMKRASNQSWFDYDHDGDLDVYIGGGIMGRGRPNFLFENLVGADNSWIAIRLEGDGDRINRDAIGARVSFEIGGRQISREVRAGRGTYASQDTRVLHFGFGSYRGKLEGTVAWPDGTTQAIAFDGEDLGAYWRITADQEPRRLE